MHDGADQGDAGLLWSFTDGGVVQQLLEVGDAGLFLALLLAGGVVATILLEVTLFAALIDLGGQDRAVLLQGEQLRVESVVGFLGEPGGLIVCHLRHPPWKLFQ